MLGVLVLIVRVLLVLFVIRLLRYTWSVLTHPARPAPPAAIDLVRDQVCGTFVPRDRALVARVDGRDAHFCSTACRDRARGAA